MSNGYGVARAVVVILELIGWFTVAAGVTGGLFVMSEGLPLPSVALAAGAMLAGFLTVATAQIVKAQIATAESTAEMLELMRKGARASGGAQPRVQSPPGPSMTRGAPSQSPAGGSGVGSVIKRYKGKPIVREVDGVSVDGKGNFGTVLEAERAIDRGLD